MVQLIGVNKNKELNIVKILNNVGIAIF